MRFALEEEPPERESPKKTLPPIRDEEEEKVDGISLKRKSHDTQQSLEKRLFESEGSNGMLTPSKKTKSYPRMPEGKPVIDSIDPSTKWWCINLKSSKMNYATSLGNGFFYILWEISSKVRNEYYFKIHRSTSMNIFIGVQQVYDDGFEVEYEYAWRLNLKTGVKYDDDGGMVDYTTQVIKQGDTIGLTVDGPTLSFSLNDVPLGLAYEDERLTATNLRPFCCVCKGDQIEILKGYG